MNIGIFDRYRALIVIPPFLWLGIFVVAALVLLLVISFSEPEFGIVPYKSLLQIQDNKLQISPYFESYKILFQDSFYLKALINSLKLALISTIFTFILAYPMAYVMYRSSPRQRMLLLVLTIAPFWTALLIRMYGWIMILKPNGLLNQFLLWSGLIDTPLALLNSQTAIVIGIVYTYLPFMILPIYSSLLKIKENVLEAAADLGAKPLSIFWEITFPLSLPGVIVGIVLVFIPAVGEFVIPDLLGGAKIITVGKLLWPMAAAITIVMVLIVLAPIKILHHFYGEK